MKEKLHKILACSGYGSRRKIENIIKQGFIKINGRVATLGERVEVTSDLNIYFNDQLISINNPLEQRCRVLIYYKPEGEICTCSDPEGRQTVFNHLPKLHNARWISVGRMDINSCGLLLFTTDGELANRLMHPSYQIEREYAVRVFGKINNNKLRKLSYGIKIKDNHISSFKAINFIRGEGMNKWYSVTLSEGRNREVRRLWESVGIQVNRLIRIRYNGILLSKRISDGDILELNVAQIRYLRDLVKLN